MLNLSHVGSGVGFVDINQTQAIGAFENVQLVGDYDLYGDFGALAEKGLWSRNMILAVGAGFLATAASAFLLGKSLSYVRR